jgi:hypothetical protein
MSCTDRLDTGNANKARSQSILTNLRGISVRVGATLPHKESPCKKPQNALLRTAGKMRV